MTTSTPNNTANNPANNPANDLANTTANDLANTTTNATAVNPNPSMGKPLWTGILLIILGVTAIVLPNIATLVTATWIAIILTSAGFAKLFYSFQTRGSQSGFVWQLLLSILYIATGIMLFVNPLTGVISLTLLLASFLLTEGIFEVIYAFRVRPQQNWSWVLGDGIITLVLGGMIWFQWPFNAPWLLGTLVGASVIFTGISRVMLSLNRRSINPSDQAASA